MSHPAATDAWYEFANLLIWTRTLGERLDRPARRQKKFRNQGLLPALKPRRLAKRVDVLVGQLPLGEVRWLANFVLHQALVRHPYWGAEVDATGTVRLPIPDASSGPVAHWHVLTWAQHRDGIAYADELWRAVEDFIDGLLTAFESAVPKRLRRTEPE